jgi:hypothetical protein
LRRYGEYSAGWYAVEVQVQAAGVPNANDVSGTLWTDGTLKQTLSRIDNDTLSIDSVCLGAMSMDTATRGSINFDDFASRPLSYI